MLISGLFFLGWMFCSLVAVFSLVSGLYGLLLRRGQSCPFWQLVDKSEGEREDWGECCEGAERVEVGMKVDLLPEVLMFSMASSGAGSLYPVFH